MPFSSYIPIIILFLILLHGALMIEKELSLNNNTFIFSIISIVLFILLTILVLQLNRNLIYKRESYFMKKNPSNKNNEYVKNFTINENLQNQQKGKPQYKTRSYMKYILLCIFFVTGILAVIIFTKNSFNCESYLPIKYLETIPFVKNVISPNNATINNASNTTNNASPQDNTSTSNNANTAMPQPLQTQNNTKTLDPTQKSIDLQNNKNITKLVHIYEEMKPDEAAKILETLPDDAVVDILQKMNSDQSAKILSLLNPPKATIISEKLLSYKASPLK